MDYARGIRQVSQFAWVAFLLAWEEDILWLKNGFRHQSEAISERWAHARLTPKVNNRLWPILFSSSSLPTQNCREETENYITWNLSWKSGIKLCWVKIEIRGDRTYKIEFLKAYMVVKKYSLQFIASGNLLILPSRFSEIPKRQLCRQISIIR